VGFDNDSSFPLWKFSGGVTRLRQA
jgi:hypothetical protein